MAEILLGKPVADRIREKARLDAETLLSAGIAPALAIIRLGEKPDDLAYESSIQRGCRSAHVSVETYDLPEGTTQDGILRLIHNLNNEPGVHGILPLRPLPSHLNDDRVRNAVQPQKDVDGITDASLAGVFTGSGTGFSPCTAEACVLLIKEQQPDLTGKHAVIVGRSLIVGRPLAMLLMKENATVTICHSHTSHLAKWTRQGDIVAAALGQPRKLGGECFTSGQTVVDVGIHVLPDGRLCGDVDYDQAAAVVAAITPVPGGVGAVTTALLIAHVVEAARRQTAQREA